MGYHSDRTEHLSVLSELFELKNKRIKVTVTVEAEKKWNAPKTSIKNCIDNKLFKWNLEYGILDVWSLFLRCEEEGQQTRH